MVTGYRLARRKVVSTTPHDYDNDYDYDYDYDYVHVHVHVHVHEHGLSCSEVMQVMFTRG
jgi:hypothetical protein